MNPRIRKLVAVVLVAYVALFAKLNQIQVVQAKSLNNRVDNNRQVTRDFNSPRGLIVSADGKILAQSVATPDSRFKYQRQYPPGDLFSHVVGTFSFQFGSDGVERQYGDQLSGRTSELQFPSLGDLFNDTPNVGDVHLTLRSDVQQVAKDALGARKGSVVAMDPRTGAIIAMWSYPSYDANLVATNDVAASKAMRELLDASPDKPRLARSYRDRYFPGSTFKVVTASAGLVSGKVTDQTPVYPFQSSFVPPASARPLRNFGGSTCGGALPVLLKVSCNTGFAEMGSVTLGPQPMIERSEAMGFNSVPPIDLPGAVASTYPTDFGKRLKPGANPGDADVYTNSAKLAQTAIGQNDVSATPLQMALVISAAANQGRIMVPHVLAEVTDARERVVQRYTNSVWRTAITTDAAATLRADLIGVVQGGTAVGLQIPGLEVGGKTGTAQLGTTPPKSHAWILGFAGLPGQPPEIAVAVIVEGQEGASEQTGGKVAAPIAKAVIQAALGR